MQLKLSKVRLAFPALFVAKKIADSEPSFSANFILDPTDPQVAWIRQAIIEVAKEKWGNDAAANIKELNAKDRLCLHNGDTKARFDGFPGNVFISARSMKRPLVLGADKAPLTQADGKPYAGCYVNAIIELYAQDNQFGKRVNASLMGVMFASDGPQFGGGAAATPEMFDAFEAAPEGPGADPWN